jgi:hypothetical protein
MKNFQKPLDFFKKLTYIIYMMNDMMPTIAEALTAAIEAQLDFEREERERENAERWESHEANDGPLFTPREWSEHCADYEHWLTYGVSPMAEMTQ